MSDDLIYGIRNDIDELLVARDSLAKRISELEKNIPEWIKNGDIMIHDPLNKDIAELKIENKNLKKELKQTRIDIVEDLYEYEDTVDLRKKWEGKEQ